MEKAFVDGGSKEKLVLQEFKSVALGELSYVLINNIEYGVKKLETSRYDTYISSEINLKPKQLHYLKIILQKHCKHWRLIMWKISLNFI